MFSSSATRAPICTSYPGAVASATAVRCAACAPHQRRGAARRSLLIHGIGSQWQMWSRCSIALAASARSIALDLPGFGESLPLAARAPSGRALARSAAASSTASGVERAHVAGQLARRRGRAASSGGWGRALGLRALARRLRARAGRSPTRSRRCASRAAWRRALRADRRRLARSARCAVRSRRSCRAPGAVPPADWRARAQPRPLAGLPRHAAAVRDWRWPERPAADRPTTSPGATTTGCCSTAPQSARARAGAAGGAARHADRLRARPDVGRPASRSRACCSRRASA